MKLKKEVVSVVVNLICTVICAFLAGCRISLGKFDIEDFNGELFTTATNVLNSIER